MQLFMTTDFGRKMTPAVFVPASQVYKHIYPLLCKTIGSKRIALV